MPNSSASLRHVCFALARQHPRCGAHVPNLGNEAVSTLSTWSPALAALPEIPAWTGNKMRSTLGANSTAVVGRNLGGGLGAAARGLSGWSCGAAKSSFGGGFGAAAGTGYGMSLTRGPCSLSAASASAAAGTAGKGSTCSGGRGHGSALLAIRSITGLSNVEPSVLRKARVLSSGVGGLAGAIGSLVGVGGGVIITPIIGAACKSLPQRVVSGTSLAAVIATGSASGYVYWSNGYVDLTSAAVIGASALLTASAGAAATHKFDCAKLRCFLGWWLYLVAVIVPAKAALEAYRQMEPQKQQLQPQPPNVATQGRHTDTEQATSSAAAWSAALAEAIRGPPALNSDSAHGFSGFRALRGSDAALAAVGGVSGFASGLLGIGGGTVVTPLLAVLSGMPQAAVVGTSLAGMALPACAGLFKHARLNNVDWLMAAGLSFGSIAGSYNCSSLALSAPPHTMEAAFSVGMAVMGNRTLAGLRKKT